MSISDTSIGVEVTAVTNSPAYYATELIATEKVLLHCMVSDVFVIAVTSTLLEVSQIDKPILLLRQPS